MIRTRVCELLGIDHPVALGGMPTAYNTAALAAAVSEAGGVGIIGCTHLEPEKIAEIAADVRRRTDKPFGLNSLLFMDDTKGYAAALDAGPALISLAWARTDFQTSPKLLRRRSRCDSERLPIQSVAHHFRSDLRAVARDRKP